MVGSVSDCAFLCNGLLKHEQARQVCQCRCCDRCCSRRNCWAVLSVITIAVAPCPQARRRAIIGGGVGAIVGGVAGYLICKDEPAPAPPVAPPPAPKPAPAPAKIILNGVQFDFNKAVIKAEYNPVLDAAASALQKQGDKKVMITGYTCSMGPDAYNQKLSEKRAAAVKAYLVDKGISASRLMTSGGGESKPVADNATKAGREMNRRAELVVIN